jgi:hypothetical protein
MFIRLTLVLCATSLCLALLADVLIVALVHAVGGIGIFTRNPERLTIIVATLVFVGWNLSLVAGWFIAGRLHVLPLVR